MSPMISFSPPAGSRSRRTRVRFRKRRPGAAARFPINRSVPSPPPLTYRRAAAPLTAARGGRRCRAAHARSGGGSGRGFESRRRRPAHPAASRSPAMDAAPEDGPAGAEAEPDGLPCPEPPAPRLSVAELDRELDSRSELVRRHFRAGAARLAPRWDGRAAPRPPLCAPSGGMGGSGKRSPRAPRER